MSESEQAAPEPQWSRLDKRTVQVTLLRMIGFAFAAGVPATIGIAGKNSLGLALAWVVPAAVVLIAGVTAADYVHWRVVRFRVTGERFEQRADFIVHTRKALARERIRSVDITAGVLHRMVGVAVVTIGTGQQGSSEQIKLDPVSREQAHWLRAELLNRPAGTEASGQGEPAGPGAGTVLARLDWGWIRYAPVSFVAPLLGAAAFGGALNVAGWFGLREGVLDWTYQLLIGASIVVGALLLVIAALVVGVIGSLAIFVERWWNYRLEREPGGTLRVRRGLLTTRSITIEERRLRGVEVVEPVGVRAVKAARVDAVMTGLRQGGEGDKQQDLRTLLPPAPRAVADDVAAKVLAEDVSPTVAARLIPHPRAALGRRLRWALFAVAGLVTVLVVLGLLLTEVLLHVAWISAVVLTPVAVLLARDAYRNLGHAVSGRFLVARSGAVRRSTVALERAGVIGWTARQSIFQRRAGLLTLTATTAAGSGAYSAYDVAEGEGLAFAEEAVPDLFGPFLERVEA